MTAESESQTKSRMNESEAILRAREGDAEGFAYLYDSHRKHVYGICLRMLKNSADAEDLTQQAFLQVFRKIGTFRGESEFSTWLHRITIGAVLMHLRRKKPTEALAEDVGSAPANGEASGELAADDVSLLGAIDRLNLRRALHKLPSGCRQFFLLHHVIGYKYAEIAAAPGTETAAGFVAWENLGTGARRRLRLKTRRRNCHGGFGLFCLERFSALPLVNTKEKQMARFVLVHGGFSGAWIWLPLMDSLRAAGHLVEAFDLPGMGDDHTSASEVSLDSYAGRVCEVLAANSEPAVVVGHSMGGIVATQAAARCPARVAALVYVAAFLPKDGQSLVDLTKLPEGDGEQVLANVVVEGEPPVAVMPAAASRHVLYGSCAEDLAAWAIARQCPQPVSPLSVAVSIPPGALNGINRYYVLCTLDRAIPPPLQRRMVAENTCADAIELDTDHTPQLSMTNQLAKALHRFATHSSAGAGRLADRKDRAAAGE